MAAIWPKKWEFILPTRAPTPKDTTDMQTRRAPAFVAAALCGTFLAPLAKAQMPTWMTPYHPDYVTCTAPPLFAAYGFNLQADPCAGNVVWRPNGPTWVGEALAWTHSILPLGPQLKDVEWRFSPQVMLLAFEDGDICAASGGASLQSGDVRLNWDGNLCGDWGGVGLSHKTKIGAVLDKR